MDEAQTADALRAAMRELRSKLDEVERLALVLADKERGDDDRHR